MTFGFSLINLDRTIIILENVYVLIIYQHFSLLHPPLVDIFSAAPLPRFFLSFQFPVRRQEHRIAIAEKTVAFFNRMLIGLHDAIISGKSRHQHQQC